MVNAARFFADVAQAPKGGAAHWLTCSDGVRIRVAHWQAKKKKGCKGTVFILPGRTEYIEKYGPAAGEFLDRGFAALSIDWRGQGIADRLIPNRALGHVGEFSDYQLDLNAALDHARDLGLPEPYYMCAHSMGGCIGLRRLMGDHPFKAVAFSAPMWGVQIHPALMRGVAWGLTSVAPTLGLSDMKAPGTEEETYVIYGDFEGNSLTTDADMWAMMKTQCSAHSDLSLGGPTVHWIGRALREMRKLSQLPSPDVPCVTHIGTAEKIVDLDRIHSRMAAWPKGSKTVVDGAEHEIIVEIPATRDRFFEDANSLFSANP